ncbi:hypothetical protein [Loigolactobacillus binensis]|uniref:YxlC family protein n=1 Tax=Loigolactobacillus binensis TaxID=2559922 RepID=A0ABW3EBN2_9LACO|nr:hypothetical protein [Loigolactobacillus binensis]
MKNNDERNFLVSMWNKVAQLESEARLAAREKQQRHAKRLRQLKRLLILVVIASSLLLVMLQTDFAVTMSTQIILILLCWLLDVRTDLGGTRK